jgi:hypothetical protein
VEKTMHCFLRQVSLSSSRGRDHEAQSDLGQPSGGRDKGTAGPTPQIAAESMSATANPTICSENETTAAGTVAVPLEMLKKIVDFCAQTLRETSELKRIFSKLVTPPRRKSPRTLLDVK